MSHLLSIYGYQISRNCNQYKETHDVNYKAVSWIRQLVAYLSLLQHNFNPRLVHVGFVVDKVVMGQVFL
jgi:hypothetical protein